MGYLSQTEKEIRDAYTFLRHKNNTISSETLQFMLDASLEKLSRPTNGETALFDDEENVKVLNSEPAILVEDGAGLIWVSPKRLKRIDNEPIT